MPITRMKLKEGDKVMYKDQKATVLKTGRGKIEIRDVYGYPRSVSRKELSPFNG